MYKDKIITFPLFNTCYPQNLARNLASFFGYFFRIGLTSPQKLGKAKINILIQTNGSYGLLLLGVLKPIAFRVFGLSCFSISSSR